MDSYTEKNRPSFGAFFGYSDMLLVQNKVDKTITSQEEDSLNAQKAQCNDTSLPEFWLDMCNNIPTDVSEYVNLAKNPERWTGYNGSHVWNAIYEENCFEKLGSLDEMCYEERVLYRLLSGMHASTNIHISLEYFPPSKSAGRENWQPNPERFMTQYGQHPDRLKNLHFSFVVLLRAVRKAAPYLYNYPFVSGDEEEDKRTSMLVQRLLDSHIMKSCSQVFEAFDETLMFSEDDEPSVQATLKSQFKGVFQNISEVMDCISCQKCKLHGKLQLLGLGTALKILLLPEQMIATSLSRSEIVAIFNTLYKFSGTIKTIPYLSQLYWQKQESYKADGILEEVPVPSRNESLNSSHSVLRFMDDGDVQERKAEEPTMRFDAMGGMEFSGAPGGEGYASLDAGVAAVAGLAVKGLIEEKEEDAAIDALMSLDPAILVLSKHYSKMDPRR